MAASVDRRTEIDGGVRLQFADGVDIAELAGLLQAEQECCRFFTFNLSMGPEGVALDMTGPAAARPIIDALVGTS
jgi:hypothetical protein